MASLRAFEVWSRSMFAVPGLGRSLAGASWKPILAIVYSLNSFKGVLEGIVYGTILGVIRGDTWSLD